MKTLAVKKSHAVSEESWLGLNILAPNEATWYDFNLLDRVDKPRKKFTNTNPVLKLNIQVDPDVQKYTRSIYSGLDWLGDVGGLYDGLSLIGYIALTLF